MKEFDVKSLQNARAAEIYKFHDKCFQDIYSANQKLLKSDTIYVHLLTNEEINDLVDKLKNLGFGVNVEYDYSRKYLHVTW